MNRTSCTNSAKLQLKRKLNPKGSSQDEDSQVSTPKKGKRNAKQQVSPRARSSCDDEPLPKQKPVEKFVLNQLKSQN